MVFGLLVGLVPLRGLLQWTPNYGQIGLEFCETEDHLRCLVGSVLVVLSSRFPDVMSAEQPRVGCRGGELPTCC